MLSLRNLVRYGLAAGAIGGMVAGADAQDPVMRYGDTLIGFVPKHIRQQGDDAINTYFEQASQRELAEGSTAVQPASHEDLELLPNESSGCSDCQSCGSCGSDGGCNGCSTPRFWVRGQYLLWWTKGMEVPVLATTSSTPTAARATVLGEPGTSIVFGGGELSTDARSGGRYTLGMWLDMHDAHGIELTYMDLQADDAEFRGSNANFAALGRPFFNLVNAMEDSRLIVAPDVSSGSLEIHSGATFESYELDYRRRTLDSCDCRVEYVLGYRHTRLDDALLIRESTLGLSGPAQGAELELFDSFATTNQFDGGEIGVRWARKRNECWSLDFLAKVALGSTQSSTLITGQTIATPEDADPISTNVGLLTQRSNIGLFEQDTFSTVTELGIQLQRHFVCDLTLSFGYTFVNWSHVVRSGETVDRVINTTQLPPGDLDGEARPMPLLDWNSFQAHGLTFGLEYLF